MKKSKVYTRTGDTGTSSLCGGVRVPKNHIRLHAYGTIDELNSFLGLLRAQDIEENDKEDIFQIQKDLFKIGYVLSSDKEVESQISEENIRWIERKIDEIDSNLMPLTDFVIPPGIQSAALAHVVRTICRRAERYSLDVYQQYKFQEVILEYLNRISDYFFVLSRKLSQN